MHISALTVGKNDEELMTEIGIGADEFVGDNGDDSLVGCA